VLSVFPAMATTEVEKDVDGGPSRGCYRYFRQRPPPKLTTSMTAPLGVLSVFPAAATIEVEDDVDDRPPGGAVSISRSGHHRCRRCRWQATYGVLSVFLAATTIDVEDVDGGPPGRCCRYFRQRPPLKLKTSMAAPLGGAVGSPNSGHH
jgi:hypothetical protein